MRFLFLLIFILIKNQTSPSPPPWGGGGGGGRLLPLSITLFSLLLTVGGLRVLTQARLHCVTVSQALGSMIPKKGVPVHKPK